MWLFRWASPSTLSCGNAQGFAFVHLACQHLIFIKFLIYGLCYDRAASYFNLIFLLTECFMLPDWIFHLYIAFVILFYPFVEFSESLFFSFLFAPWIHQFFSCAGPFFFTPNCGASSLGLCTSLWSSLHRGITLNSLNPFKGPFYSQHLGLKNFFWWSLYQPLQAPCLNCVLLFSYMVDSSRGMTHFLILGSSEIGIITHIRNSSHHIHFFRFFCFLALPSQSSNSFSYFRNSTPFSFFFFFGHATRLVGS